MRFPAFDGDLAGLVAPVAALRGRGDIGVGEFPDLIELGELAVRAGLSLIQVLPLNDSGFQSSPYSALSAFALHPLYLSLSRLPEGKNFSAELKALKERFADQERFPYDQVLEAKLALARRLFDSSLVQTRALAQTGGELANWIAENQWVIEYAVYRRIKANRAGRHWREWPEKRTDIAQLWDDPKLRDEHLFWVWLQYHLDAQLREAAEALSLMGIALKGDIPILMNEDSCDVWAHPDLFRMDLYAGAPPDMFSPLGQNWGFPIYNWEAMEADGYLWWKRRLALADKYYSAYRIDHVLGFFRIWALSRDDSSAVLGRFIPSEGLNRSELHELGFNDERLRWLSRPHLSTDFIRTALEKNNALSEGEVNAVFHTALERIGDEELWVFKKAIHGDRDIDALSLSSAAKKLLQKAWWDRCLIEFEEGKFSPTWTYWDSGSYGTLNDDERRLLDGLIKRKRASSEAVWEEQGRRLLSVFRDTTPMLSCAEDLGAVPDCVPRVLTDLGILGLRIFRWSKLWGTEGEPFIPLSEYPELSVCAPSVHDSSTVREWWEREADRPAVRRFLGDETLPDAYTPDTARILLSAITEARSRLCVFQIQDLLHLSSAWYAADPATERINIPGSVNSFNWTYRLPASLSQLTEDSALLGLIRSILKHRARRDTGAAHKPSANKPNKNRTGAARRSGSLKDSL